MVDDNDCSTKLIMELMDKIDYGWVDKFGCKHYPAEEIDFDKYILQKPDEAFISKIGLCWDQVELERMYFNTVNIYAKTYFMYYYIDNDDDSKPSHTFLVYEKDGAYYWFEHAWAKYRGIHRYISLKALLSDVSYKFLSNVINNNNGCNGCNFFLSNYETPRFHISGEEFYEHCTRYKNINLFEE